MKCVDKSEISVFGCEQIIKDDRQLNDASKSDKQKMNRH